MPLKRKIGQVTPEQRDEIQKIFERKNGLIELFQTVNPTNQQLYDKIVKDMGETSHKFQQWWDNMAVCYNWEKVERGSWEINFENCEIFLNIS